MNCFVVCIHVAINTWVILWSLFYVKNATWLGIVNNLGEPIYRIENRYATQVSFCLDIDCFANNNISSTKETKKIFVLETTSDVNPEIIIESL